MQVIHRLQFSVNNTLQIELLSFWLALVFCRQVMSWQSTFYSLTNKSTSPTWNKFMILFKIWTSYECNQLWILRLKKSIFTRWLVQFKTKQISAPRLSGDNFCFMFYAVWRNSELSVDKKLFGAYMTNHDSLTSHVTRHSSTRDVSSFMNSSLSDTYCILFTSSQRISWINWW